jgi:hypothetical protein
LQHPWKIINAHILVGKPDGKRSHGRFIRTWDDNIKILASPGVTYADLIDLKVS